MRFARSFVFGATFFLFCALCAFAKPHPDEVCPRPAVGSTVAEPENLRSEKGVLRTELIYRNGLDRNGHMCFCYVAKDGSEAPTLRLHPGDLLILTLKNALTAFPKAANQTANPMAMAMPMIVPEACGSHKMTATSTNLHFHGLTVPPTCHQDDVLRTVIQPSDPPFEYRFRIPADAPPGLYWYHPHVHGYTNAQVKGGASGALIVEGIERANQEVSGLPQRVLIVRDQDLENPDAIPTAADSVSLPPVRLDADGDIINTGTGTGKPARDLSLNFIPVSYPAYKPAVIEMEPGKQELWRVLNASSLTYLNLQLMFGDKEQALGVVALDGMPIRVSGMKGSQAIWQTHLGIPPGGRMEFIVKGPPGGVKATLVTRTVNTGPIGENDPDRPLATIIASEKAAKPATSLPANSSPLPNPSVQWLGNVQPVRTRKLYFSEQLSDPKDPNSPTQFFLTIDGQTPKMFDPRSTVPDITVQQGDVEDWVIENRTQEVHAFHIHQVHFMLMEWYGLPVSEPFLRDTVNVPFWDGKSSIYPIVKLRMDFRDPNAIGTFVYHCHILEHEDGGMMGTIQVNPKNEGKKLAKAHTETTRRLCGTPIHLTASVRPASFVNAKSNIHKSATK